MTLEEKLESLGYECEDSLFCKKFSDSCELAIECEDSKIKRSAVCVAVAIESQKQLDDLQIAFNVLKSDLKELENDN